MLDNAVTQAIKAALMERFGGEFAIDPTLDGLSGLAKMAGHRSHRRYAPRPVEADLLRLLRGCTISRSRTIISISSSTRPWTAPS
jgi:hypothetical protein